MCKLVRFFSSLSICLFGLAGSGDGARILASVATPSYSHQVAFRNIWKELAKRGHEIVLLTTDPMKEDIKNMRQIDLSSSYDVMNHYNFSTTVSSNDSSSFWSFVKKSVVSIGEAQRHQLLLPEIQELIRNPNEHFDLLMLEVVFPIHIGFVERFKVPVIGLISLDAHRNWHLFMGNDDHPILHPQIGLSLSHPLTFLDRTVSKILK